jgi:hypothetical protein
MIQGFSGGLLNRELIYNLDLPSFQRDFASLKTLNHGTGPAITFTRASGATYFDANGVLQTAAEDGPRFDHDPVNGNSRGLLIEEARTNAIRNSQGGGSTNGVIGSGGVAPTEWIVGDNDSGLAVEIVGTGTEAGFSYVDIRYYGTASFASEFFVGTEIVSASNGQTLTGSIFVRQVAGSTANIATAQLRTRAGSAGNLSLAMVNSSDVLSGLAGLTSVSHARISSTVTATDATTAFANTFFALTHDSGAAIDITLRIAAPQLELGAFPTSYIPTTTAAATRSADSAVVTPISSFYNQSEGTLFAEGSSNDSTSGRFPLIAQLGTDTDNRIFLSRNVATSNGRLSALDAGATQVGTDLGSWLIGSVAKLIAGYKENDFSATINGASVTTDTSGTVPPASSLRIGSNAIATGQPGGHIRKIAYYPKRLTNALLEQLTT